MSRFVLALRDALDERVILVWILAAAVLFAGRWYAAAVTMGAPGRGALAFGLWWCWVAAGALAAWMGSRALAEPLASGSARFLLVGPVSPGRWALERGAASASVCAVFTATLGAVLVALEPSTALTGWLLLLVGETVLVAFVGLLMGVWAPPLPALALTAGIWWIAHLLGPVALVAEARGWSGLWLAALPDLDVLDGQSAVLHGTPLGWGELAVGGAWCVAWTGVLAAATVGSVARRDL